MREILKNSVIYIILILVILFNQNILILLGNINKMFLKNNQTTNQEIKVLKTENNDLKNNINELNAIVNLNKYDFDYEVSSIIVRNIYQIYETITVEKGNNYGIKKGDPVLNEFGLVGVVKKVNKKTSEVLLITSTKTDISIKVSNSFGFLSGYENNYLIGSQISNYDDINIGDLVYTSGLGTLPKDLYVGKVKEINLGDYNIEQEIYIEMDNKIEDLKYLIILKNLKEV